MSKNVWIINDYAGSPDYGMTFRHYYLAREFVKRGFKTTIITASYSHFLKKFPDVGNQNYKTEIIDEIEYLWIKVLNYGESFDKRRILKWFEFSRKIKRIHKVIKNTPSYIICSTQAPFAIKSSIFLSKKTNAKLIFEVRDIWPLTLIEVGGYSNKHPFIRYMHKYERLALKESDIIVSNLQNYSKHVLNLGIDRKVHWVSNGIADSELKKTKDSLSVDVKNKIPRDKFIVGYTGKLGVSNTIDCLIEVAKGLNNYEDILFVIVGKGQEEENLKKQAKGFSNIMFIDAIPKNQVSEMLSLFDVCYIGLHRESLFTYGVSPNKLFDYMYSGKSILYAIDSGETNIVKDAKCGLVVEPENIKAIQEGILKLYKLNEIERIEMGIRGRNYVLKNFTYSKLSEKYIDIFEGS